MMFRTEVKEKIEQELAHGIEARKEGYEGRARVCARRASGAAVREFLRLKGIPSPGPSAVDLLEVIQTLPGLPAEIGQAAQRLLMRVDEDFSLPGEVNLLDDARWLAQELEKNCC